MEAGGSNTRFAQRSESAASWLAGQGYHSCSGNIMAIRDITASRIWWLHRNIMATQEYRGYSRDIIAIAGISLLQGPQSLLWISSVS